MNIWTCSAKHSPGATTLALALTAALAEEMGERPPVLVECDPAGGDLAARLGLPADPGLASFAAAARHGDAEGGLWRHANQLPAGGAVLLAPTDPTRCQAAARHAAPALGSWIDTARINCVFDAGRAADGALPPGLGAVPVLVVCRPDVSGIEHTRRLVRQLSAAEVGREVVVVAVGERPYPPSDVASATGVPARSVPHDAAGAASLLAGPARRALRSPLVRSARSLVDHLLTGATL